MEKIWLKSYPPGVPAEINPEAYSSMVEVFESACKKFADRPAFYNLGTTITYKQLDELSRDFAAYLQQILQFKPGDRIGIMLPNILQYPVVMFGALRAGLVIVNINPLYTVDELSFQLNNSAAKAIVVLSNFASTVQEAMTRAPQLKTVIITDIGDMLPPVKAWIMYLVLKFYYHKIPGYFIPGAIRLKEALTSGKHLTHKPVALKPEDIAFLQYTGGTTGVAKGAILTHRNIIANMEQATAWVNALLVPGKEIVITALPLYHIFSLTANCMFFTKIGGLNVLITNPRDIPTTVKEIRKFKFTAITGVNTLFNGLLNDVNFAKADFSALKFTLGGGTAVQRKVAEHWQSVTGNVLLGAYGLTETSPCVTINPYTCTAFNGTVGLPVSSTDVCILDDDGKELGINEAGELAVKGPQVMRGYWNSPAETDHVFKNGWLLTGDIASINEEGYVTILERKKDMVLVSGFNVYPNEVEEILARMDGIREAAVIGVIDDHTGEAVKAFVVRSDESLTPEAIKLFCRKHLTPYKVPKYIEFCSELPKTNVGKVLRRALKTQ